MKTDTLSAPASCWVPGEPVEPGFYLFRFVYWGRVWVYLFESYKDRDDMLIYMAATGGNRKYDTRISQHGVVTHHCLPTPENFALAHAEMLENQRLLREHFKATDSQ